MREDVCTALKLIRQKNRKYELKTLEAKAESIQREMEEFSLRILFVGGFSAGKSALINGMLGRELLEEGQRPETAIASEVLYDAKEFIEAVSAQGKDSYAIEEARDIDIQRYDYLVWHLNCPALRKFTNCTIVDMPGFNSGIKDHNKAILQYAGKGNAYILVIDCEEGSIKQNIMDFVAEIKNYDDNMAIVITKTDLKTEEDIKKVRDGIAASADMLFGMKMPVIATSKYDGQVREKVMDVIRRFDSERIFFYEFAPQVHNLGSGCIDSLEIYKKSLRLDISQFDEEIARHERTKKELADKLKREKGKLENKFRNSVAPSIIGEVQEALYGRVDALANSLQAGEKNFSATVNNILRPILVSSTQRYVEQSFDKFISEIDIEEPKFDGSLQDISSHALAQYQQANEKMQEIAKNGDKFNAVYKTVTTALAVTTSVVAPWLELILIFLPDIFKLLGGGKGSQENSLKNKVNNEIIPQIIDRLQPEIEASLMDMKEELIAQAEEQIGSLIESEKESLQSAKEKKSEMKTEFEHKMEEVQSDIDEIRNVLDGIA